MSESEAEKAEAVAKIDAQIEELNAKNFDEVKALDQERYKRSKERRNTRRTRDDREERPRNRRRRDYDDEEEDQDREDEEVVEKVDLSFDPSPRGRDPSTRRTSS